MRLEARAAGKYSQLSIGLLQSMSWIFMWYCEEYKDDYQVFGEMCRVRKTIARIRTKSTVVETLIGSHGSEGDNGWGVQIVEVG